MSIEVEGTRQRGRPRKTWRDCGKVDVQSFGLSHEDAQDMDQWRLKIKGKSPHPGLPGKWPLKRCVCSRARTGRLFTNIVVS